MLPAFRGHGTSNQRKFITNHSFETLIVRQAKRELCADSTQGFSILLADTARRDAIAVAEEARAWIARQIHIPEGSGAIVSVVFAIAA